MSSRFRWLSKVVMVVAVPTLILAIVFLLPPALAAATDHASGAASGHAPIALSALAALHSLAAPPAPPAPPDPPDSTAPRAYHRHHHQEDGEDAAESAWLGVTLSEIDEEGTRVAGVADDSPAAEAGLEKGDRIVGIEGKKVLSSRDVVRAVRAASPGDKVTIRILRDGDEKTLTATLAGRKTRERHEFRFVTPEGEDIDIEMPDIPEMPDTPWPPGHGMHVFAGGSRTWLGVELHPMSPELREALKAPSDRGLLINRVVEDSPAKAAGLQAGDVIIAVGGKGVEGIGDIGEALRDREAGDSVEVKVVRDGSERTLNVKLDEKPAPARGRRGFHLPGGFDDEERIVIEKRVSEAMEMAHKAMREANEQLRVEHDRMRSDQDEMRQEIQKQMKELKEKLRMAPAAVIRARTIHDI